MFDLLRPLTKALTVIAFVAAYLAANAMLLYVVTSCQDAAECIGAGNTAAVVNSLREWSSILLPGNFYYCLQIMFATVVARRAYDVGVKILDTTAKAS